MAELEDAATPRTQESVPLLDPPDAGQETLKIDHRLPDTSDNPVPADLRRILRDAGPRLFHQPKPVASSTEQAPCRGKCARFAANVPTRSDDSGLDRDRVSGFGTRRERQPDVLRAFGLRRSSTGGTSREADERRTFSGVSRTTNGTRRRYDPSRGGQAHGEFPPRLAAGVVSVADETGAFRGCRRAASERRASIQYVPARIGHYVNRKIGEGGMGGLRRA